MTFSVSLRLADNFVDVLFNNQNEKIFMGKKMYRKILRITAIATILIGLLALIAGTRTLMGLFDPGYDTFNLLVIYNVFMGIVSLIAGYYIWKSYIVAQKISAAILAGHIIVLVLLLTLFNDIIATQSIQAMTFRVVVWSAIFITIYKVFKLKN